MCGKGVYMCKYMYTLRYLCVVTLADLDCRASEGLHLAHGAAPMTAQRSCKWRTMSSKDGYCRGLNNTHVMSPYF